MIERSTHPEWPTADFNKSYLDAAIATLRSISPVAVQRLAARLLDAYVRGAQVFVAGNGGSAALASHFVCDLSKGVLGKDALRARRRFRAISLSDNTAVMTAWGNDTRYEEIFAQQVRAMGQPGDLLLVISASGNSPNILEAIRVARDQEMATIAWLGFDGGKAKSMVDDYVCVGVNDYGLAEAAHDVIAHLLTSWLTRALESFPQPAPRPTLVRDED